MEKYEGEVNEGRCGKRMGRMMDTQVKIFMGRFLVFRYATYGCSTLLREHGQITPYTYYSGDLGGCATPETKRGYPFRQNQVRVHEIL